MEQIQFIPLDKLVESKTNPRQIFDDASLNELAASIREKGVLDPIKVRLLTLGNQYEIIDGARRFRAAKMGPTGIGKSIPMMPAFVVTMTDEEVAQMQMIGFLQRKDLGAIEEAEGFAKLQKQSKLDIAMIAEKTGKPKKYVAERLQLTKLIPIARKYFIDEQMTVGAAIAIAKLPEALQKTAAKYIDDESFNNRTMRDKEVTDFISRNLMLNLSSAPFKLSDEKLLPQAGACTVCPKNTQSSPDLFGETKKADHCLDRECFGKKIAAYIAIKEKEAEDKNEPLIRLSENYSEVPKGAIGRHDYYSSTAKKGNAVGILVDGSKAGQIVHVEMTKKQSEKAEDVGTGKPSEALRRARYNRRMQIHSNKVEAEVRSRLVAELFTKVKTVTEGDLRTIARWITKNHLGYNHKPFFEFLKVKAFNVDGLNSHQLVRLMLGLAIADKERIIDPLSGRPSMPMLANLEKVYKLGRDRITKEVETDLEAMKPKPFKPAEKPKKEASGLIQKESRVQSGVCRICGCTESTPCIISGESCWWVDKTKTLCSNPKCTFAAPAEGKLKSKPKAAAKKQSPKKKTKKATRKK